jgi:glycolate oxidase
MNLEDRKMPYKYNKLDEDLVKRIEGIVGREWVICDKEKMDDYAHDEYPLLDFNAFPDIVVKPGSTEEVSEIVKLAWENSIPVTPRGSGTGLCGGCVADGGISLSLERMDNIVEIDEENFLVTAEAGVKLMDLFKAVEARGLFFPPHPGDESATVGGTIATNAGGSRAVKYGVMRNFVRGLEVVLPNGDVERLGTKTVKDCSGYSLVNLFIGSEGTLGVVTEGILKLAPPPGAMMTLIAIYERLEDAIDTVPKIIKRGLSPVSIEFIDRRVIPPTEKLLGKRWPTSEGEVYLMLIVDAKDEEALMQMGEEVVDICMANDASDVLVADAKERQDDILEIRSNIYLALKRDVVEILDITVPVSRIADYVRRSEELSERYGMEILTYGHAGDGNLHFHIMKGGDKASYPLLRKELHRVGIEMGGVVSGEHGIGLAKKEYLEMMGEGKIELMRRIKKALDEKNIMNPGKIFDL